MRQYLKGMWNGKSKYLVVILAIISVVSWQWWVLLGIPVVFIGKSISVYNKIKQERMQAKKRLLEEEKKLEREQEIQIDMGNCPTGKTNKQTHQMQNKPIFQLKSNANNRFIANPNNRSNHTYEERKINSSDNVSNIQSTNNLNTKESKVNDSNNMDEERKMNDNSSNVQSNTNSTTEERNSDRNNEVNQEERRYENLQYIYDTATRIYEVAANRDQNAGGVRQYDTDIVQHLNPGELIRIFGGADRSVKKEIISRLIELGVVAIRDSMIEDTKLVDIMCNLHDRMSNQLRQMHTSFCSIANDQQLLHQAIRSMSKHTEIVLEMTEIANRQIQRATEEIQKLEKLVEQSIQQDKQMYEEMGTLYKQRDEEMGTLYKQRDKEMGTLCKQRDEEEKQRYEEMRKKLDMAEKILRHQGGGNKNTTSWKDFVGGSRGNNNTPDLL